MTKTFRYPKLFEITTFYLHLPSILILIGLVWLFSTFPSQPSSSRFLYLLGFVVLALIVSVLLPQLTVTLPREIEVSEEGIEIKGLWRRRKIPWGKIIRVEKRYDPFWSVLIGRYRPYGTIRRPGPYTRENAWRIVYKLDGSESGFTFTKDLLEVEELIGIIRRKEHINVF